MSKARIAASWLVELLEDAGYAVGTWDAELEYLGPPDIDEVARILAEAAKKAGVIFDKEADRGE